MNNKYFIYLILIVLIISLFKIREDFSEEITTVEEIYPIEDIKLPNVSVPNIPLLKKGERFELLDLPFCNQKFYALYAPNTNNIVNDGSKIYQDMLKPYEQEAEIGNKKQGLTQISWKKSYFSYNGKPVPLELQFTHVAPDTGKVTNIVFPLSFTPEKVTESFTDSIKTETKNESEDITQIDFGKLGELNSLIKSTNEVPEKIPGQINIGQLLNFNLCKPSSLILDQRKFFFANTVKNELLLIAKPQIFDRTVGKKIMANLNEPDIDLVLPETK